LEQKTKRKIPVYLQILIGMCIGIVAGIIAIYANGQQIIIDWVKPWGQIFIRMLQLVAVPLVFISLVKGVIGLGDISRFSKMGLKTIALYVITTIIAILIGVTLVSVIKPGQFFDASQTIVMNESIGSAMEERRAQGGPLNFLYEIVPNNIFAAASDNSKMMQVIFFALMFGVAALTIGKKEIKPVLKLVNSLYAIILKMVDFIIKAAPYGVTALMAGLVVDTSGDMGLFSALAVYGLTVMAGLMMICFGLYPLFMKLFRGMPIKRFIKEAYPAQLVAFSTSSSAATLPVTMDVAINRLGLPKETVSFVMPTGATLNTDGTSLFQAVSIVFIAQVLGLDLTFGQMITIILMTTISSIGTPGIPGGSYVVMTMVLTSIGIPPQALALILGVDRPLDMMRTVVNVTGDFVVTAMVAPKMKEEGRGEREEGRGKR